jgi:hypothetical protein
VPHQAQPLTPPAAACPANAVGGPDCVCAPGFAGALAWSNGAWTGQCVGERQHYCIGALGVVFDKPLPCICATYSSPGQLPAARPTRAARRTARARLATRGRSHGATVTTAGRAPARVGFFCLHATHPQALTLAAASCPRNASGAPSCACDVGFTGALAWAGSSWQGSCAGKHEPSMTSHLFASLCVVSLCARTTAAVRTARFFFVFRLSLLISTCDLRLTFPPAHHRACQRCRAPSTHRASQTAHASGPRASPVK